MKKLEHLLYQDESVKRVSTLPSMVSYRSARKLSSYLVRAKLYPLQRKRGSYKCGNLRCLVSNNIEETDTFTSTVTSPAGIYLFKVNNRNTRTRCEICSKLTINTPERRHWRRSGVFIVNFEHISHLVLVFLLLTLNK